MEDMDLKQERRYCSRIGAALLFVLIWTSAWQYGIIALDVYILPVRMPDTLYYALILVGGRPRARADRGRYGKRDAARGQHRLRVPARTAV